MRSSSKGQNNSNHRTTVYIVEDHPVFREGLRQMLSRESDLFVCGEASEAAEALRAIHRLKPDLVIVDITLPGKSGLELVKEVRASKLKAKLLVLSMHDEALYAARALRAGGDGYIMKEEDPTEVVHAIRDVLAGHIYVSDEVFDEHKGKPVQEPGKGKDRLLDLLSDAELEVLEGLGKGKSEEEIAKQLKLSNREVAKACLEMRRKLRLGSNNALVRYAVCWAEAGE
jgi:DNA-binding NarL/FixJ family response regulator